MSEGGFSAGEGSSPDIGQDFHIEQRGEMNAQTEASRGWLSRMKENSAYHFYRGASALAGAVTGFNSAYISTGDYRAGIGAGVGGAFGGWGSADVMIRIWKQAEDEEAGEDGGEGEESINGDE